MILIFCYFFNKPPPGIIKFCTVHLEVGFSDFVNWIAAAYYGKYDYQKFSKNMLPPTSTSREVNDLWKFALLSSLTFTLDSSTVFKSCYKR